MTAEKQENTMQPTPTLAAELAELPAGLPAVVLLGDTVALVGAYVPGFEVLPGPDADTATITITLPACTCPHPQNDIDPDCPRHYPPVLAELRHRAALAVAASRGWTHGGSPIRVPGAGESDVYAAQAVLLELLQPGRSGILR